MCGSSIAPARAGSVSSAIDASAEPRCWWSGPAVRQVLRPRVGRAAAEQRLHPDGHRGGPPGHPPGGRRRRARGTASGFCQWGAVGPLARGTGLPRRSSRRTIRAPRWSASTEGGTHDGQPDGNSERLRVGIIGGRRDHPGRPSAGAQEAQDRSRSRAICDTDLPKARALADRFGVKDAFDDIEELLRYEALDAVVICSPNHLHESHILAGAVGQPARPGREAAGHVRRQRASGSSSAVREARARRDGRDEPPLPARRADRAQLRAERRAGHGRERARQLARLPPQPQPARLAAAARPGRRRCHARSRPLDPRPRPLAGRQSRRPSG